MHITDDVLESERKFLVDGLPDEALTAPFMNIIQGYMSDDVRVRVLLYDWVDPTEKVTKDMIETAYITRKSSTDDVMTRIEEEYKISADAAEILLDVCGSRVLRKIRYLIQYEGFEWEVDEFFGSLRGLYLAECEATPDILKSSDFKIPDFCGHEVTGNSSFSNATLAERGYY